MVSLVDNILNIYEENSKIRKAFDREESNDFGKALGIFDRETKKNKNLEKADFTNLDGFFSEQFCYYINQLLDQIPPDMILDKLGENALLWHLHNSRHTEREDDVKMCVATSVNINLSLFRKASESSSYCLYGSGCGNGSIALSFYDLIEGFEHGRYNLDNIDLARKLTECSVVGRLSEERKRAYGLETVKTSGEAPSGPEKKWARWNIKNNEHIGVYMDGPLGIALMYKGEPNAVVCFVPTPPKSLLIHQIQGVRPFKEDGRGGFIGKASRGLPPLDWTRLMVRCVEGMARKLDFEETIIRAAKYNKWTMPKFQTEREGISLKKAERIYDRTAERARYIQSRNGNWHKSLI